MPLVSTLALHPCQPLKAWARRVLNALTSAPSPAADPQPAGALLPKPATKVALRGTACLAQQASDLLTSMWQYAQVAAQPKEGLGAPNNPSHPGLQHGPSQAPFIWLGRFRKALKKAPGAPLDDETRQGRPLSCQQDEVMQMILTALLDHPQPGVQAAAAAACAAAVQTFPITGISLLPLLIYKLQRSVDLSQQGEHSHNSFCTWSCR